MALLIGLSLNFLSEQDRLTSGLDLSSGPLLRLGIVLTGFRVTAAQISTIHPFAFLGVLVAMGVTFAAGWAVARAFKLDREFGLLAGAAVAICGASAVMAVSALLGDRKETRALVAMTLMGISLMSGLALIFYPIIATEVGLTDFQAGYFVGASIHDVAQAIAAGYSLSDASGDVAVVTKLARVAMLGPILLVIAMLWRGPVTGTARFPWFVALFAICVGINSLVTLPEAVKQAMAGLSNALITLAVIATAIRAPIASFLTFGIKPIVAIALITGASAVTALSIALAL
jgi:uncharacterized integral membrane protein (TIGR00698 family)